MTEHEIMTRIEAQADFGFGVPLPPDDDTVVALINRGWLQEVELTDEDIPPGYKVYGWTEQGADEWDI